ncbi:MAG: DegV family protein [Chloroflexi bacterium]|nr:DegV family protein [Chloroflexota bacterium]
MTKIAIVTDSTACIPKELVDELGIWVVPINIEYQGVIYRDGIDLLPGDFYKLLEKVEKAPHTSPASPGAYLEVYKEASKNAEAILCITLLSRLSAMYDAARLATEMAQGLLPDTEIRVLDSRTATMAQGFVVLAAARAAAQGKSLEEVTQAAEELKPKVQVLAFLDTLNYLAKSGRIPKAGAWAASLLHMKPVISLANGEISLVTAVRSRQSGMNRLMELIEERTERKGPLHIAVIHAGAPQEAERLKERIKSQFQCSELLVTEFTPVMGVYTGPGLLGLAFYS